MPSLPAQTITAEAADKTEYKQRVTCGVTTEGIFTIGIPDDLVEIVRDNSVESGRHFDSRGLRYNYFHGKPRLECRTLKVGVDFLQKCALQFITAETITERVIVYSREISAVFWIDGKGIFRPNGDPGKVKGGAWWKPAERNHERPGATFSIGIGAGVFDRITHKRNSGDRVEWKYVHDSKDPAIEKLNSFIGGHPDPEETRDCEEMPYTPEAAEFFSAAMFAICKMAKSLHEFLEDKPRLLDAIAKGSGGLLTFPGGKP